MTFFFFSQTTTTGRLSIDCALELIRRTKEILVQEPNIVTVHPPTVGLLFFFFFPLFFLDFKRFFFLTFGEK